MIDGVAWARAGWKRLPVPALRRSVPPLTIFAVP